MSVLDQLKNVTKVVADTGDFDSMIQFKPVDATTNPSLILQATNKEKYQHLIDDAVEHAKKAAGTKELQIEQCIDKLFINFGMEILKIVPGRVSTEVDARLSFDTEATVEKARKLINMYTESGITKDRILIKIASTWEGVQAAAILEKEGIHCNMTLLFSLVQAVACADVGATLISPFVGRIYDWYKLHDNVDDIPKEKDPGVQSVKDIFHYYKTFGYKTEIMGASFRTSGQITELAGCDLLTISPKLLHELNSMKGTLERKLDTAHLPEVKKIHVAEEYFRWLLNEDAMATEKLAEGIRKFNSDHDKLRLFVTKQL